MITTHKAPRPKINKMWIFRWYDITSFANAGSGRMRIIISKNIFTPALAQPRALASKHLAGASPSHFVQAARMGVHWKIERRMKTTLYKILPAITMWTIFLKSLWGNTRR